MSINIFIGLIWPNKGNTEYSVRTAPIASSLAESHIIIRGSNSWSWGGGGISFNLHCAVLMSLVDTTLVITCRSAITTNDHQRIKSGFSKLIVIRWWEVEILFFGSNIFSLMEKCFVLFRFVLPFGFIDTKSYFYVFLSK